MPPAQHLKSCDAALASDYRVSRSSGDASIQKPSSNMIFYRGVLACCVSELVHQDERLTVAGQGDPVPRVAGVRRPERANRSKFHRGNCRRTDIGRGSLRGAERRRLVRAAWHDALMSESKPEPGGEDRTIDLSESLSHSAEVIGIDAVDGLAPHSMALDSADPDSDD